MNGSWEEPDDRAGQSVARDGREALGADGGKWIHNWKWIHNSHDCKKLHELRMSVDRPECGRES